MNDDTKKRSTISDLIRNVIGDDPDREGLQETPSRVIKAYEELFGGYKINPESLFKTFEDGKTDEMVIVRNIEFTSFCEHHLLPFEGTISIGYLPDGRILGLSKFARIVEVYSKRLQVQERLTEQIAESIQEHLMPKGVGVIAVASHKCMSCRGVRQKSATMVTSKMLRAFHTDPKTRSEFLTLLGV